MSDNLTPPVPETPPVNDAFVDIEYDEGPALVPPVDVPLTETVVEAEGRPLQNVLLEFCCSRPGTLDGHEPIDMPTTHDKETREVMENLPNVNLMDSPEAARWAQILGEGMSFTTLKETFVPTLEDQEAEFHQIIDSEGTLMGANQPKQSAVANQSMKGERATIRLFHHLGLGTLFQVPLYHSGFWVTFKPPAESEIVEFNRMVVTDKITFGRMSYGLAFSNTSSYMVDRLMEFALRHIYDISVRKEDINEDNLKQHISCQDIPSFLWGFVNTMYPKGYNYRRSCINDPEKCNHVLEEILNLSKLQMTNSNALTPWQKVHMSSRRSRSKTLDEVKRYRSELLRIQQRKITLTKDGKTLGLTIRTPSVAEYIDAGHRWIGDIVSNVNNVLDSDAPITERNIVIQRHGQATAMRQYAHWIHSIEFDTLEVNDRETIEANLDVLSADDALRQDYTKGVVDYINHSTISVIGIPAYDCPKCEAPQDLPLKFPMHSSIIPLDVVQLFFVLLVRRIEKIAQR